MGVGWEEGVWGWERTPVIGVTAVTLVKVLTPLFQVCEQVWDGLFQMCEWVWGGRREGSLLLGHEASMPLCRCHGKGGRLSGVND